MNQKETTMSPTVKTTLTKTLILVFFALTAFFVLPGGVSAEEKAVGAFTVTGGQQDTDYTYADNTLTVNTGAVLTIKNTDSTTSTADKIVVMSGVTANITLDGVKIDVSSNENSCAFAVKSGAKLNLTLAAGSENSLKSGANCAGLNVPKDAELTIGSEGANPGSLTAQCGGNIRKFPYGAGIGRLCRGFRRARLCSGSRASTRARRIRARPSWRQGPIRRTFQGSWTCW